MAEESVIEFFEVRDGVVLLGLEKATTETLFLSKPQIAGWEKMSKDGSLYPFQLEKMGDTKEGRIYRVIEWQNHRMKKGDKGEKC